jgi:cytoskeletal protein CcmA (bactofilin family)
MNDAKDHKRTLVEEGTELKGSLSSSCPILVRGKIEGDIKAPALTVSPTGAVHGRAKVTELEADGELSGEFDADMVALSGSVKDKTVIRAKTLSVKLASENGKLQVMFGECELEVGEPAPSAEE